MKFNLKEKKENIKEEIDEKKEMKNHQFLNPYLFKKKQKSMVRRFAK